MNREERAGPVDYFVFFVVVLGALYFLLTGQPFDLGSRFPLLNLEVLKFLALLSLIGGSFYTVYLVISSFLSSVRKFETLIRSRDYRK